MNDTTKVIPITVAPIVCPIMSKKYPNMEERRQLCHVPETREHHLRVQTGTGCHDGESHCFPCETYPEMANKEAQEQEARPYVQHKKVAAYQASA